MIAAEIRCDETEPMLASSFAKNEACDGGNGLIQPPAATSEEKQAQPYGSISADSVPCKSKDGPHDGVANRDIETHGTITTGTVTQDTQLLPNLKWYGRSALIIVAFLNCTLNMSIRGVYALPGPPSPSALSFVRGWLVYICFVPFLIRARPAASTGSANRHGAGGESGNHSNKEDGTLGSSMPAADVPPMWRVALELAFWNGSTEGLQYLGLTTLSSARVSFLTQFSLVMTPTISAIVGQRVKSKVWVGCFVALAGLVFVAGDKGLATGMSPGDLIIFCSAFAWSMYMLRTSQFGDHYDELELQGRKNLYLALMYTVWFLIAWAWSPVSLWPGYTNLAAWSLIFFSAVGAGFIADVLQQKGQALIDASESNVILAMAPVFTAILGRLLLGEELDVEEKIGGALIVVATLISDS